MLSGTPMKIQKDSLPFDMWVAIAAYLPITSILSLRLSCKDLYDMMGARAVWSLVVQDLIGIMPFHVVRHNSHLMSTQELMRRAIRAARIDVLLDREVIRPIKIIQIDIHPGVAKAVIAPGGQWMLMLLEDGAIHLHPAGNLTQPPILVIPRPDCTLSRHWNVTDTNNNIIITSTRGDYLIVASESFNGPNGTKFAQFRVYHLDVDTPSIRLLTTVTRPDLYCDSCFREGLLVTGWQESGSYLLSVRRIPLNPGDIEEEVIMDLGPVMADNQPMLKVVCPHLIAISTQYESFLFLIPEMRPFHANHPPHIIQATPLSIHTPENRNDIWNSLCCHRDGRIAMASTSDGADFLLVIWPPAGQPEDTFVRHLLWQFDMNPSRAIWVRHHHFSDVLNLYVCTHLTRSDRNIGYMRLGRSKAPHPSRVISVQVPLVGQGGSIKDLSWDEESARIGVLFVCSTDGGLEKKHLMMVDLE